MVGAGAEWTKLMAQGRRHMVNPEVGPRIVPRPDIVARTIPVASVLAAVIVAVVPPIVVAILTALDASVAVVTTIAVIGMGRREHCKRRHTSQHEGSNGTHGDLDYLPIQTRELAESFHPRGDAGASGPRAGPTAQEAGKRSHGMP